MRVFNMLGADWMRNQRSDGWEIFRVDGGLLLPEPTTLAQPLGTARRLGLSSLCELNFSYLTANSISACPMGRVAWFNSPTQCFSFMKTVWGTSVGWRRWVSLAWLQVPSQCRSSPRRRALLHKRNGGHPKRGWSRNSRIIKKWQKYLLSWVFNYVQTNTHFQRNKHHFWKWKFPFWRQ